MIADHFPTYWINVGSGALFPLFGILILVGKDDGREMKVDGRNAIISTASLMNLMELRVRVHILRPSSPLQQSRHGLPWHHAGLGRRARRGRRLIKIVPERYLRYIAGALFIAFGFVFLAAAFLGIELF